MRDTIEDIEDARTIERLKKAHGHKPRTDVAPQYHHPERMAITQARVARHELPWEHASKATFYPGEGYISVRPGRSYCPCRTRPGHRATRGLATTKVGAVSAPGRKFGGVF